MALVGGISFIFYKIIHEDITGFVAMIFNILMYAAPGEKIFQVFKTKQYKLIPIFSTIGGLSCSLCWLIFAIYKMDINMIIPNGLGLLFAILQIIVYLIFYCKKKKEENFDIEDDDKLA
jgi:solute carrier family 50 protein (sugar transporter)